MVKPTGRKRIDIAKIENERNLQVTFSKRRDGLFKKLSELYILCGGESATVVFSPVNNSVYSIGHSSVIPVVDNYIMGNRLPTTGVCLIEPHQNTNLIALCEEVKIIEKMVESEINHGKEVQAKNSKDSYEKLNNLQLQEVSETFEAKMKMVEKVAHQQQECGIPFVYKTYGLALAPREYISSSSSVRPSESR